jgi:hypothetical protein
MKKEREREVKVVRWWPKRWQTVAPLLADVNVPKLIKKN